MVTSSSNHAGGRKAFAAFSSHRSAGSANDQLSGQKDVFAFLPPRNNIEQKPDGFFRDLLYRLFDCRNRRIIIFPYVNAVVSGHGHVLGNPLLPGELVVRASSGPVGRLAKEA